MRNIKLLIEYDGTNFVGWQTQANGRSVQQEIEKILEQVLQGRVNLIGAGRTDSGVHARGQVANFRTNSAMDLPSIMGALKGLLPDDITVHSAQEVPENFHSRYDARERVYRYYISLLPHAVGRHYHWYVRYALDFNSMRSIAGVLLGEHDFVSFCKADTEVHHHRCTVTRSEWSRTDEQLVYDVRANRFLHGMVRALVGSMVDIGRGRTSESDFRELVSAKRRRKTGTVAPPCGLFLDQVLY